MFKTLTMVAALLFAAGCGLYTPALRDEPPVELPAQYALYSGGEQGPGQWWRSFDSPELNRLIETSLEGNFDLKTAWARLSQAQATAAKTGANQYPDLNLEGGVSLQRKHAHSGSKDTNITTETQTWNLGAAASYEVDLWGRLSSERQADVILVHAAREDLESAAMTVAASVAKSWVSILALRQEVDILKEQIRANQDLLELQELRFRNGKASALAVSQQRQTLAASRSELPLKELSTQTQLNALALLLGKSSSQGLLVKDTRLPGLIPLPPSGLPASLLASRPDVHAAGLRVRSAQWDVSTARANRLPKLNLSASSALNAAANSLFFENWLLTLASSLTAPIIDGGERKAEVERTRAVAEEKLHTYAKTVAEAVKEVEDDLASESRQREYLVLLQEQLDAARITLKNAQVQYQNGQSDYQDYLTAWTSVQRLERQLVVEQANLIKYRIDLHRALGGDWTAQLDQAGPDEGTAAKASQKTL